MVKSYVISSVSAIPIFIIRSMCFTNLLLRKSLHLTCLWGWYRLIAYKVWQDSNSSSFFPIKHKNNLTFNTRYPKGNVYCLKLKHHLNAWIDINEDDLQFCIMSTAFYD